MPFHTVLLTFIFSTLAFALEKTEIESNGQNYPWKMPPIPRADVPVHHNVARPAAPQNAIKPEVVKKVREAKDLRKKKIEGKSKTPVHSHSLPHKSSKDEHVPDNSKPHLRAAERASGDSKQAHNVVADASHKSSEPVPAHFAAGKANKHKVSHIVTASAHSINDDDVSKAERAALDIAAASQPLKSQSLALESKTPEAAGGPSLMRREIATSDKGNSLASFEAEREREKNLQNMILDAQSNLAHLNALVAAEKEQQEKFREAELQKKLNARQNPGAPPTSADLNGTAICEGRSWTPRQCWMIGCCKFTPKTVLYLANGTTVNGPGRCLSAVGVDACDTGSLVTGPLMCEHHGFDQAACNLVGCCQFVNGACESAVGNNYCDLHQTYDGAGVFSPGGGIGADGVTDMTAVFHYVNQDGTAN